MVVALDSGRTTVSKNSACDLDLEMRSKEHEISIGTAAFRLAPPVGGLLVVCEVVD